MPRNYYGERYGFTRSERAQNMLTDVLSGAKFCRQVGNGDWEVQTQTNPDLYVLHRVFPVTKNNVYVLGFPKELRRRR